jgi:CRP/FNR family transcriptional regulator, nitrogen fixation regulation protein
MNNLSIIGKRFPRGLRTVGSVLCFVENQEIYGEGENADAFFKVVSGVVRTCKFLADGRRQIDAFHVPGDLFGFEVAAGYSLSAEAVCNSTVLSYRRRDLALSTADNPALANQLLLYAMRNVARAQAHSVLLGRATAVEKVAAFLVDWAAYSPDSNVITLAMTRQDIADYLGLTIETVSRTLSRLAREAFIEISAVRQIRLSDRKGLRDLNALDFA